MFYPEKMSRVTVAAPRMHLKKVIDTLYTLKAVHIEEYMPKKQGDFPIGTPLKEAEKISELLIEINAIKKMFPPSAVKKKVKMNLREAASFVKKLKANADSLNSGLKKISESLSENEKSLQDLEFLSRCGIDDPRILAEYNTLRMVSGYAGSTADLEKE